MTLNVTSANYIVLAMFGLIHTEPVVQIIKTLIENSMRVFIICTTSSIFHSQNEKLLETCKDKINNFPLPRNYFHSLKIRVLVFKTERREYPTLYSQVFLYRNLPKKHPLIS